MLEISLALIVISYMGYRLLDRYLDQRALEFDKKEALNSDAAEAAISAATAELHKQFDSRINKSFENHQLIKAELESIRAQIAFKGNR